MNRFLFNYCNVSDYRHLFSSKEWILTFLDVYAPSENFLIQSNNGRNYFSLSVFNDQIVFTGDPFNDFNGMFNNDFSDTYNLKETIKYLIKRGYKMEWTNLFEENMIKELEKNKMGVINEREIGLKILNKNNKSYGDIVSKRILRMYDKFSDRLLFSRAFGDEIYNKPYLLDHLLSVRQAKLLMKKTEEYNLSFEQKFNEFITKLVSFESLWKNVFIDYVMDKRINEAVAMSFNFIKDGNIICYLRSHIPSLNQISYGLILDYWSNTKNFNEGCKIIDLSRGNESYKYRLGANEYHLNEFVIF